MLYSHAKHSVRVSFFLVGLEGEREGGVNRINYLPRGLAMKMGSLVQI